MSAPGERGSRWSTALGSIVLGMLSAATIISPVARRPAELIAVGAVGVAAVLLIARGDRHLLRRSAVHLGLLLAASIWLVARVEPPWGSGSRSFARPTLYPVNLIDYLPFLWAFVILALFPFTARDRRIYLTAVVATVPIHTAMVVAQMWLGWHGRWAWELNGWPVVETTIRDLSRGGRATGGFGNGNHLALAACYGLLAAAALLHACFSERDRHGRARRVALGAAVIASSWMLIVSGSRVTWAVVAAVVVIYTLVLRPRFRVVALTSIAVGAALVVTSVNEFGSATRAARVVVPDVVWGRITDGAEFRSDDLSWRVGVWECGLDLIGERPLDGWGLGTFGPECEDRRRAEFPRRTIPDGGINHAHNLAVQVAAELGVPFTVAVTSWMLWIGRGATARLKRAPPSEDRSLRVGLLVIVVAVLAISQINLSVAHDTGFGIVFWVCAAMLVAPLDGPQAGRRHDRRG